MSIMTIKELLTGKASGYVIPFYQRNFAWTYGEIEQLVVDILDSIDDKKPEYYIGTLVLCPGGENEYDIIDGQQRFTAVLLLCLAIQNSYSGLKAKPITDLNLSFKARRVSNETLKKLLLNTADSISDKDIQNNEILVGYKNVKDILKELIGDKKIAEFYDTLLNKVKLFIDRMPEKTDKNLYFERFNSRGEQLESHEIIKAELMGKLTKDGCDIKTIQKFAKVWDACSELETPCIKFFEKKTKGADADNERELIFKCEWAEYEQGKNSWRYGFNLGNIYRHIHVNKENRQSLLEALEGKKDTANEESSSGAEDEIDSVDKYRCIINFNTFLYYVLYITDNTQDIQLDDKKLQSAFNARSRDKDWILAFGINLLKARFIFDNLIIRNALETTSRQREGEWFLQKAYREDKNDKRRGHLYVQTRFDKNSFAFRNNEIVMLQSMFAVTFTAYKDTKWLFTALKFLFTNASKLNDPDFGQKFYVFLEDLSKEFAHERICDSSRKIDNEKMRYDKGIPVYAFNFMDYVLWKNQTALTKTFPHVRFGEFRFTYRRSIEHWYPQTPNEEEGKSKMSWDLLHSFGNLCIIVASQYSEFGRLHPDAKLGNWRHIFNTQSLKLQMMAHNTNEWKGWDESHRDTIAKMEADLVSRLNAYLSDPVANDPEKRV